MGCAASTRASGRPGRYENDGDSEGDISDVSSQASVHSDTSGKSNKSVTKVVSTRGKMASSSSVLPRLSITSSSPRVFDPTDIMLSDEAHLNTATKSPEAFMWEGIAFDPKDAVRLRVERLNRIRRPSHGNLLINHQPPVASAASRTLFAFNDLVIFDDEETVLPEPEHKFIVPTGFKKLAAYKMQALIGHTDRVKALVMGADERSFLSAAITDSVIAMGDLSSGQELNCYPGHEAYIVTMSLSRDGKFFASSARDGSIAVWEYSTNREHALKKQVRAFSPDEVQNTISISMAFGYVNRFLIAGGQDGCCRVWDIDRPDRVMSLAYDKHTNVIVCVAPHPSDHIAASASGDKTVHVWRYDTGETIAKLTGHESAVISVSFTPEGAKLLSNDDRSCRVWNPMTAECIRIIKIDEILHYPTPHHERNRPRSIDARREFCIRYPGFMENLENALRGPHTVAARAAQVERVTAKTIFTVSCLLPGVLSNSYFAVACTTGEVLLVNLITGQLEGALKTKAPVFAIHTGSVEKILLGDIFGNIYVASFRSAGGQS